MFVSDSKLPHLLSPVCYFDELWYQKECAKVIEPAWHVVATTPELSRSGDFVTAVVAGKSIQVRNFDGKLVALSNVCAHRHALISSQACGNSPTMRCQYHGWEYQEDGRTGKIPEPKNFVPFDRQKTCLPIYRVETLGQLVFVNTQSGSPSLIESLGEEFYSRVADRFSNAWTLALRWQPEYPTNWKVPIENSLEAYHVPAVHPHTFREDPGAERSTHELLTNRTSFSTSLPFSPHSRLDNAFQKLEARFVRWLGLQSTGRYEQHQVFPNLLLSFTDAISLCNCIIPESPRSCRAVVRQFGRLPDRRGAIKRLAAVWWSRLTAGITKKVLVEDMAIFSAIQRGLEMSPQVGMLGRCEERIHSFQEFVKSACGETT